MAHELRKVMRSFATGVCVAATYTDTPQGRRHDAVTVNSLTSVSLDPPLVSVSLPKGSDFLTDVLASGLWTVSILDAQADRLAQALAADRAGRAAALREGPAVFGEHTGALIWPTTGWMECAVRDHFDAGDRTVVLGQVLGTGAVADSSPLIYLYGRYHAIGGQRQVTPTAHPVSAVDIR